MDSFFSQLSSWITSFISSAGYLGIVVLIALENIFPPLPSEIILPLTGFLVNKGELHFFGVLVASTLGSVLGALFLYYVSRKLGEERVYTLADRYGKFLGLSKSDVKRAIQWFHKHGGKLVFFGRVIPTIRSVISIPAGLADMNIKRFIIYTSLGSALWNGTLISIGWILGDRWQDVQNYTKYLEYVVWAGVIATIVWIIVRKGRAK